MRGTECAMHEVDSVRYVCMRGTECAMHEVDSVRYVRMRGTECATHEGDSVHHIRVKSARLMRGSKRAINEGSKRAQKARKGIGSKSHSDSLLQLSMCTQTTGTVLRM